MMTLVEMWVLWIVSVSPSSELLGDPPSDFLSMDITESTILVFVVP